jgi:RNA polymerase sigma factor (TIGR02999 family)
MLIAGNLSKDWHVIDQSLTIDDVTNVTRILSAVEQGDQHAAAQLLPLVYDELRRLAAQRIAQEKPGHTLQATALVHEAYLRLTAGTKRDSGETKFEHRGHFFAVAAEAMRRILVENARAKQCLKRGGGQRRSSTPPEAWPEPQSDPLELLAIHEALDQLAVRSPRKAELVKLRYFLGCTIPEAAQLLNIAPATAEEDWTYARAWLRQRLRPDEQKTPQTSKKVTGG